MLRLFLLLILFMHWYCSSNVPEESPDVPEESLDVFEKESSDVFEKELSDVSEKESLRDFYAQYEPTLCVNKLFKHSGVESPPYISMRAFGPPKGAGVGAGSLDVFVIGDDDEAIFLLDSYVLEDGEGDDLKVFENVFEFADFGDPSYYRDLGTLEVSADGTNWYGFLADNEMAGEQSLKNLVGVNPTSVHYVKNPIDPRGSEAGGDAFDLSKAKKILDRSSNDPSKYTYGNTLSEDNVSAVRYFKIVDGGDALSDGATGQNFFDNGIDIDAICLFYPVKE